MVTAMVLRSVSERPRVGVEPRDAARRRTVGGGERDRRFAPLVEGGPACNRRRVEVLGPSNGVVPGLTPLASMSVGCLLRGRAAARGWVEPDGARLLNPRPAVGLFPGSHAPPQGLGG